MGCSIGWGGVVFEEAGDAGVEVWEGEDLLLPVFEGVDVGPHLPLQGGSLWASDEGYLWREV